MMSVADEIAKLDALHQSGAITKEEYEQLKTALLEKQVSSSPDAIHINIPSFDVNNWGMFIHLSQFCGYIVPLAGLIVPIILWQLKKDEDPRIDLHGKIVANWIITMLIMGAVFGVLSAFIIGIPLLVALAVAAIAFPIVGGVKANNGEAWRYPLSIRFFPLDE
jgi:uncharacterized Tic20 family protein